LKAATQTYHRTDCELSRDLDQLMSVCWWMLQSFVFHQRRTIHPFFPWFAFQSRKAWASHQASWV